MLKTLKLLVLLAACWNLQARADLISSGTLDASIPQGNLSGYSDSLNASGAGSQITDVTVTLNVSGGYNGGLYAYLSYDGVLVTLLDKVGTGLAGEPQYTFGFSTAGFNDITLDDAATADGSIHDVANPVPGNSYMPDDGSLASFNGKNPNGTWTIFFADLTEGGGTSVLDSWSVDITAIATVPAPMNTSMGLLGALTSLAALAKITGRSRAQDFSPAG
jgi:subtilisin-like proprotein convertase family protein